MNDHRPEINGLRAVAVLPVIFNHAGFSFAAGGYLGVDIFFVISGFLITGILLSDLRRGQFSLFGFYERRARRILPALVAVVAATSFFCWIWMIPVQFLQFSKSIIAVTLFYSNVFFWQTNDYFAPAAEVLPLLHTWSLAVEEQFYLIFPLLLAAIWRFGMHRVWWFLLALAVGSLLVAEWGWRNAQSANFYLAFGRAWELLAGSLVALWMARHTHRVSALWSWIGLAMILAAMLWFDETTPMPSLYGVLPVVGTALVLLCGRADVGAGRLLSFPPLVGLGLISYSAYLWHQPVFALTRLRLPEPPSPLLLAGLIGVTLALATLSWAFVEQPFRGRAGSRRFSSRSIAGLSVLSAAAMIGFGLFGITSGGASFRLPAEARMRADQFEQAVRNVNNMIRLGRCALPFAHRERALAPFLAQWDCHATADGGRRRADLAIWGDSHAGPVAAALRLNGVDVMQMSGAGCSLAPSQMDRQCRAIADRLKEEIVKDEVTSVWLVNRFHPRELLPEVISETISYWTIPGVQVSVFAPIPEFPKLEIAIIRELWYNEPADITADLGPNDRFMDAAVAGRFTAAGFRIIDSKPLFCGVRPDCAPILAGQLLMADESHMTEYGAELFGKLLLATYPVPLLQ